MLRDNHERGTVTGGGGSTEPATRSADPAPDRFAALAAELDLLRVQRDEDRALLDELMTELARHGLGATTTETVYATWTDWVDDWLVPRIDRSPHRYRWCHHYAEHPEVADRLETLWHTWETHWPQPQARLAWYRDGLDHHWPLITADDGPLRVCSAAENVHTT
ncbi:MAG: DUF4913 domain-containing protein [Kineosporiaceae bacterium]|nr:DUF4913 domain-containing protein [Kineosporiaceae bacterium]